MMLSGIFLKNYDVEWNLLEGMWKTSEKNIPGRFFSGGGGGGGAGI